MLSNLPLVVVWYLMQYADVRLAVQFGLTDAEMHYLNFGRAEGRSGNPLFNPGYYLEQNPDVAAAVDAGTTTAHDHYTQYGAAEGRGPNALFNEAFYLQQNPDVAQAVAAGEISSAAEHFINFGHREPRLINAGIDLLKYLGANPDVNQALEQEGLSPLEHLMMYGVNEGRDLGNGVSLADFKDDPAFKNAIAEGNPEAALTRVEQVAPFIPSFQRPEGWTPPADLPIPVDFVPAAGSGLKLAIPDGVTVPAGVTLPGAVFQNPTPEPSPDTSPAIRFTVSISDEGVLSFGGTAEGNISFEIHAGNLRFFRDGVQATSSNDIPLTSLTSTGDETLYLNHSVTGLSVDQASKLVAGGSILIDLNGKSYGIVDSLAHILAVVNDSVVSSAASVQTSDDAGADVSITGFNQLTGKNVSITNGAQILVTADDGGVFMLGDTSTNSVSTSSFGVIAELSDKDTISIHGYTSAASIANNHVLINEVITATSVATTGDPTLADNAVLLIRGSYSGAGDSPSYSGAADGQDALLVYDSDPSTGTAAHEAIVLVGGGSLTMSIGDDATLSFASPV